MSLFSLFLAAATSHLQCIAHVIRKATSVKLPSHATCCSFVKVVLHDSMTDVAENKTPGNLALHSNIWRYLQFGSLWLL